MKLALVCDDLIQFGGAERLVLALHEIWPEAPLFTSFASKAWQRRCRDRKIDLRTSWMQKLPFREKLFRHYFFLFPHAFETFDFNEFDVVLTVSARFAHGIITGPRTKHICYMNTPPRMFWEPFDYFGQPARRFFRSGIGNVRSRNVSWPVLLPFLSWLRVWDYNAGQRPDVLIANSKTPQDRIMKYYGREAEVVYPFVDLGRFRNTENRKQNTELGDSNPAGQEYLASVILGRSGATTPESGFWTSQNDGRCKTQKDYYLIVSRLQAWKRIDIAIEACNQLKLPLVVIGDGPDKGRLQRLAGQTVEILGNLTDEEVIDYYYGCRALIFPQVEDFGIVPLEAMAAGKPVIAAGAGGALETVIPGKTGEFFCPQTVEALGKVLKDFDPGRYDGEACKKQAGKFDKRRFVKGMVEIMSNDKAQMTNKILNPND